MTNEDVALGVAFLLNISTSDGIDAHEFEKISSSLVSDWFNVTIIS